MKTPYVAGWVLVGLVSFAMAFAGAGKFFGFAPPDITDGLQKVGLGEEIRLIGAGAMLTALLLLVPVTASLGVLLASSYWGGAICTHMAQGDSILVPVVLLVMTWGGVGLRDGRLWWSCQPAAHAPPQTETE